MNHEERQDELIRSLTEKQIRTQEQLETLVKATTKNGEDIESLEKRQNENEKLLSAMGVRISIGQWVAIAVGTGVIGYILSLIFN